MLMLATLSCCRKARHVERLLLPLFFLGKHRSSTSFDSLTQSSPSSFSEDQVTASSHPSSSLDFHGFAKSVLSKCSHLLEQKRVKNRANSSLKDLLFEIFEVVPDTARRLLRASELKPCDVLQILLGFESEFREVAIEAKKVESLWGIFKFPVEQNVGFNHLPRAYELMGSILVRVGLLGEAEMLLHDVESRGISLDNYEMFSNLIESYVGVGDVERSLYLFDEMGKRGFVPAESCYCALIDLLVRMKKSRWAVRVCLDMIEKGMSFSAQKVNFSGIVMLLCQDGRIQEARNLIKKAASFGYVPCSLVLYEIVCAYCEKKDFEDLLNFFGELNCAPDVRAGNKLINSLCWNFGSERSNLFRLELEHLGFTPDEITFGILIGWCCREGNLKSAFFYLSQILASGLKPDVYSYNAIMGSVLKEGMWKHAGHVLDEMIERGTAPDLLTYQILMAGYSKARQFDEVRAVIDRMSKLKLIQLSLTKDPLSKAFMVLGFGPSDVKLKRDSDARFSRTEFYDSLGNGLYLDTDVERFERRLNRILEDAFVPDFNSLVVKECRDGNFKCALRLVDEMVRWGQNLSKPVLSTLVKGICASQFSFRLIDCLLEKVPRSVDLLDEETLNLLVQLYSEKGFREKARTLLDGMLERGLLIENETYTALFAGLCEKQNLRELNSYVDLVREFKWVPGLEDLNVLVGYLCQNALIHEAVELFESTVVTFPVSQICDIFLEKLCGAGLSTIAYTLTREILQRGCIMEATAYSHLLRGFFREKDYSEALGIFDLMQAMRLVPCADTSVLLIPFLCKAQRFTEAITLKEAVSRDNSSLAFSFNCALLKGYAWAGEFEKAANLFQELSAMGMGSHSQPCDIMVREICKTNSLRKVEQLLAHMIRKNFSLSVSSFRMMTRLMCLEGQFLSVLSLKELRIGESDSCGLVIYNIVVFYLLLSGKSSLAKKILDELQEKKLQPDEATYNFLIQGFASTKDISSSLHYLSTMMSKQLSPSKRCLRRIISCSIELSELCVFRLLIQEMELRGWVNDSHIHNAVVAGLISHGKICEAESFVDRMVEKNLVPDGVIYDALIKELARQGKMKKAVHLLNIMLKRGNIPSFSCYNSLILGFSKSNELQQAMDVHAEMLGRGLKPSTEAWAMLIQKCCDAGESTEAEKLLVRMTEVGENPTREMYVSVINRYCFENNSRKASEFVQAMRQFGHEPDFDAQWFIISTLNMSEDKANNKGDMGFLSKLLSGSGFA